MAKQGSLYLHVVDHLWLHDSCFPAHKSLPQSAQQVGESMLELCNMHQPAVDMFGCCCMLPPLYILQLPSLAGGSGSTGSGVSPYFTMAQLTMEAPAPKHAAALAHPLATQPPVAVFVCATHTRMHITSTQQLSTQCRCCAACSPFSYSLRAIVINEMTHDRWSAPAPGNPHYLTLGQEGLETFGFFTEHFWIWVGEYSHQPDVPLVPGLVVVLWWKGGSCSLGWSAVGWW
jgi:hypothetical protein